jgi:hypothetical protein
MQWIKNIARACNSCRCALSFVIRPGLFVSTRVFFSEKIKFNIGRPACIAYIRTSNPCDHMPSNTRRGTQRPSRRER